MMAREGKVTFQNRAAPSGATTTVVKERSDMKPRGNREPAIRDRGTALIPILTLLFIAMALGYSSLVTGAAHMKQIELNRNSVQALEIAEVGLARALYELERNQDLDSVPGIGNVGGDFGGGRFDTTTTSIGNNYYRVRGLGQVRGVRREVEMIAAGPENFYARRALAARGTMTIGGVFSIDSYDSSLGSYASQATNSDAHGTYANENAKVASNDNMDAGPNAVIRGDAVLGPSATLTVHQNTYLTGTQVELPQPMTLPDPPVQGFVDAFNNNNNGAWTATNGSPNYNPTTKELRVTGQTQLTLPPGTYFFSSIALAGGASIVVTGETKIYVTGNIDFGGGGLINQTNRPQNLEIIAHPHEVPPGYVPPAQPDAQLSGGSQTACVMYAPAYDVSMGGSGVFMGAVIGKDVNVASMAFHFDESLKVAEGLISSPGRVRKFMRVAWREISLPVH